MSQSHYACAERISKEAAEKNMQELLAAEVKTQAVTEGPKKGKKKKKVSYLNAVDDIGMSGSMT